MVCAAVDRTPTLRKGNREAALHCRPSHHRVVPARDIRKVGQADLVTVVPPRPTQDGEVSDR